MKNKVSTCQMVIAKGETGGWLTPRKLSGGSTSGASWEEVMTDPPWVNDLEAKVTNSGRVEFWKNGEEVMVYVLVRPELTPKGKAALAAWNVEREKARKIEAEKQAQNDEKLSQIMEMAESIGLDAALRKLSE